MEFLRVWLMGYYDPAGLVDTLRSKPAPGLGLFAQLLRGILDSTLVYLPVALMGRIPPTPSFIPFITTEGYYFALIWLTPVVLIAILLTQSAVLHILLRLTHQKSDIDQLINLIGMSALIVGTVLIPWDWAMYLLGFGDQFILGITHLVIGLWGAIILAIGLRRTLSVPVGLAVVFSLILIPVGLPLAILFMRSPF